MATLVLKKKEKTSGMKKLFKKATPNAVKKITNFKIMLRSRHPSHNAIRNLLPKLPFRSVVRLGSEWDGDEHDRVECNSVESVRISSNKKLMKEAFDNAGVKTSDWWIQYSNTNPNPENLQYPIVAKSLHGSRGEGNFKLDTVAAFTAWMIGKNLENYIFEKFYNYSREYRLHITEEGCFYTCRKMLKTDVPVESRWFRNDSNSVWILENNVEFNKPINWDDIVAESVKALESIGLDICAVDVRVKSSTNNKGKNRENPDFIILETNSAPSFGIITQEKYLEMIPRILMNKIELVN